MSAFLPSGHDHAHSISHGTASWLNRIRAQFTALRYFALDGTGPPQPQGTGQPVHHLANNHADDERLRQIVTGQTLPDAALVVSLSGYLAGRCASNGCGTPVRPSVQAT